MLVDLKNIFASFLVFVVVDLPWLTIIAKHRYDQWLSPFERTLRYLPAIGTYFLLSLGIVFFVLPLSKGEPKTALFYGALLGAITYGVYDLTNYAVLSKWSLQMTLIDWIWGSLLCAITAFILTSLRR